MVVSFIIAIFVAKYKLMTLQEIEKKIQYLRNEKQLKVVFPEGITPLQKVVLNNIETGSNYNVISLLIYIQALGYQFILNNKEIKTLEDLGNELTSIRKECQMTQFDIQVKASITPSRIISIEKGRGYRRDTLLSYLSALQKDIEFNLKPKYDFLEQ